MLWMIGASALGFSGEEILAKVEETKSLRSKGFMEKEAPTFTKEMYEKAAKGGVVTGLVSVEGYKAKKAYGVGVVNTSIGKFYAAIGDDVSKPKYNRLSYAEVLKGGRCGERREVFMYLPLSFLTDRYWVVESRMNTGLMTASGGKVREMTWSTIEPNIPEGRTARDYAARGMKIEFARGGWWITELDPNHTLVEYWTWTDPGGYVPAGIASSFAAGGIKDTFSATEKLANDGSLCPVI